MMRRVWLALAACAVAAMAIAIVHGWRQGGLELLQIGMRICS